MIFPDRSERRAGLADQLFDECDAMAQYALSAGLDVSGNAIMTIHRLRARGDDATDGAPREAGSRDVEERDLFRLIAIHNELTALIAPALPGTLALLAREARTRSPLHFLGAVSLVRRLMLTAIGSLAAVVCLSLSPAVTSLAGASDYSTSSGTTLLLNELFLMASASLGASFSNLYVAHQYVKSGTFDPSRESDYWVRMVLGLLAGTMLALLIRLNADAPRTDLGPPIMALLGGFSATIVYEILMRMASSIEALFHGDPRSQMLAAEQAWKNRQQSHAAQQRIALAKKINATLVASAQGDMSQVQRELERLQEDLLSSSLDVARRDVAAAGDAPPA